MKYDFDLELVNNNSLLIILQQIRKNSVILEFGPANGRLTKYLKNELNCEVYLAEIDEQAGKEALQYGKDLVIGDVEQMEWFDRYRELRFDYILFADILEHLREPKRVLAQSKLLLKQEGSILVSVPNMAHNSVLIGLMNNDLQYNNIGLLDNTHIHFFTFHGLERMIRECDLYPCKRMGTYCEVGKDEIPNSVNDVPHISPEYWNSRQYGEVYQFVYELKKGKEYIGEERNLLNPYYHHYWIQTYQDDGTGMSEVVSTKVFLDINKRNQRFELAFPENCETFRIDPLNTSCVLKINCISIRNDKEEKVIEKYSSNAAFSVKDLYCFESADPMFLISTAEYKNQPQAKIIIDFDILSFDSASVRSMQEILTYLVNCCHEKDEKMAELGKRWEEEKKTNEELQRDKDELQSEIVKLRTVSTQVSAKTTRKNKFGMKG